MASLFDHSPHDPASLAARAVEARNFGGDRPGLVAFLENYNRLLGAPPATLAACRRLSRPDSVVVIGGQQPGVLTGPLYTFWKAVSVVRLAEAAARRLPTGTPVVPVFWIGAEDHDLAEIAGVAWPAPKGGLARVVYDPAEGGAVAADPAAAAAAYPVRTSVGYLPADRAAQAFLDRAESELPATEFTPSIMDLLRRTAAASANLGDWFGRLLLSLLGERGLVVANSLHPDLRALEGPIFQRMIRDNEAVSGCLARGQARVRELGYQPQVEKARDAANLYLYRGLERVPLRRLPVGTGEGVDYAAGSGPGAQRLSLGELLEIAAASPERLSPNVVLRPLAQDAVFPVLAYVGGPGETSYYALYRDLFHHFGRRGPIIYPRPNVTIIEPAVGRHLERCGLQPEEALDLDVLHRTKAGHLAEVDPIGIDAVFDRLASSVRGVYGELSEVIGAVDPSLAGLAAKNLARVGGEIEWLKGKTWQQHRRNCREAVQRFEALEAAFRPQGDYQERIHNLFAYLAKYGLELAASLAETPLIPADGAVDPDHRFIWL